MSRNTSDPIEMASFGKYLINSMKKKKYHKELWAAPFYIYNTSSKPECQPFLNWLSQPSSTVLHEFRLPSAADGPLKFNVELSRNMMEVEVPRGIVEYGECCGHNFSESSLFASILTILIYN